MFFVIIILTSLYLVEGLASWDYLVDWPTIVLQCFVTVGWVIWPIKVVPSMTYTVFGGTLNPILLYCIWLMFLSWFWQHMSMCWLTQLQFRHVCVVVVQRRRWQGMHRLFRRSCWGRVSTMWSPDRLCPMQCPHEEVYSVPCRYFNQSWSRLVSRDSVTVPFQLHFLLWSCDLCC